MLMTLLRALVLILLAAAPLLAAEDEPQLSLDLDKISFRPSDQRTEARLARWNSDPMARVAMHMNSEQALIMGGGLPGMDRPRALVFSVKLQKDLAAALMVASSASGVEFYERRMAVIKWPWDKDEESKPAMPLDEQLTIMLGNRLENQ
jgi:hypothetical protein